MNDIEIAEMEWRRELSIKRDKARLYSEEEHRVPHQKLKSRRAGEHAYSKQKRARDFRPESSQYIG